MFVVKPRTTPNAELTKNNLISVKPISIDYTMDKDVIDLH